jgi:hypothetical protein
VASSRRARVKDAGGCRNSRCGRGSPLPLPRLADHLLARINTICARAGARIADPRRGTPTARTTGEISFCAAIDAHRIKPK